MFRRFGKDIQDTEFYNTHRIWCGWALSIEKMFAGGYERKVKRKAFYFLLIISMLLQEIL
jgi:hypothetical protein